ncbi:hypothetical protein CPT_Machias_013 [Staphylococcus phage Machias]|nr:hypothetical protein CPT_Machias_013 [Staphylococcus phage Machias]WPH64163.1 hypothetical protein [Staphylococcus phage vB_StaM_PB50]
MLKINKSNLKESNLEFSGIKDSYQKAIDYIDLAFLGDQKHIVKGNEFVKLFLEKEKELNTEKYNGKLSRLDVISVNDSLKFLMRIMNNEILNPRNIVEENTISLLNKEDWKLTHKHIIRLCNQIIQLNNEEPEQQNGLYYFYIIQKTLKNNEIENVNNIEDLRELIIELVYMDIDIEYFEDKNYVTWDNVLIEEYFGRDIDIIVDQLINSKSVEF